MSDWLATHAGLASVEAGLVSKFFRTRSNLYLQYMLISF